MFKLIKYLDYSFTDACQPDGLAAFIDRVSEDPVNNLEQIPQHSMQLHHSNPISLHRNKFLDRGNIDNSNTLYSAKEYDAANMLIDYSNQKNLNLQRNFLLNSGAADQKLKQRQGIPIQHIRQISNQNNLNDGTRTHVSLVNSHTAQPFYSQAFYSDCEMGQDSNNYLDTFSGNSALQRRQTISGRTNNSGLSISTLQQQQTPSTVSIPTTSNDASRNVIRNFSLPLSTIGISTPSHVFLTTPSSMPTIPNNSMLTAATLDHYVPHILAAAAAGVSTSAAAVINSLSSSMSGNVSILNDRTTQQLITQQHPQWWLASSNPQSVKQQLPLQQQYGDDQKALQVSFYAIKILYDIIIAKLC